MAEAPLLAALTPPILAFASAASALALGHLLLQLRILTLHPDPPPGAPRPFASIVVPCRGRQPGLEENAQAFAAQDYGPHELLFVVDTPDDPSVPALEAATKGKPHARILVAEPDVVGRDWPVGKMIAQRTGALRADARSEVLVFADSDGRPERGWLASLVAPLADPGVGGVTGYRWYTAETRPHAWTLLRDAFDHMVAGGFTSRNVHMIWGGAMAFRRADFDRPEVAEEWKRCISDDLGLTNAVRYRWKKRIAFAPGALVHAPEDQSKEQIQEFLTRQVAINRASHRWMFRVTSVIFGWSALALALGLALLLLRPSPVLALAGAALVAPSVFQTLRAAMMDRLAHQALPGLAKRPAGERAATLALIWAMPWFTLWVYQRARRLRVITWRGRQYALKPGRVEPLAPPAAR